MFQCYQFLTLNKFRSKYLLKGAFASIVSEERFVCFKVLNSYIKFGDLTPCIYYSIYKSK